MTKQALRVGIIAPSPAGPHFASVISRVREVMSSRDGIVVELTRTAVDADVHERHALHHTYSRIVRKTVVPTNSAIVFTSDDAVVGVAVRSDGRQTSTRTAGPEAAAFAIADFLRTLANGRSPRPVDFGTEELIRRLYVLLDQKDALLAVFKQAYDDDIETARARIVQLETQLAALEAERLRAAARWRDPKVLGTIAVVIATVLGPVAAVLVDHALHDPVAQVVDQAHDVHVQCSVTPDGDDGLPRTG